MSGASDREALERAARSYLDALDRLDLEATIESFAADAVFEIRSDGTRLEGREAIGAMWEEVLGAHEGMTHTVTDLLVDERRRAVVTRQDFRGRPLDGGETVRSSIYHFEFDQELRLVEVAVWIDGATPGRQREAGPMIDSRDELGRLYDPPLPLVVRKTLDRLDEYCETFIARSPFVCLATSDADGHCDVSPRGDPPGFVSVLDPKTLLIPDRKGNNRLDSAKNVLASPGVGLLFLIPGIDETLRVNGVGAVVDDEDVLAPLAVRGMVPKTALRVTVEEAFIHCGRALKRSSLWDPTTHADREEIPSIAAWLRDQARPDAAEEALIENADAADLY